MFICEAMPLNTKYYCLNQNKNGQLEMYGLFAIIDKSHYYCKCIMNIFWKI